MESTIAKLKELNPDMTNKSLRKFTDTDGRVGYGLTMGFGPGGTGFVAAIPSPDRKFELQIQMFVISKGSTFTETKTTQEYYQAVSDDPLKFLIDLLIDVSQLVFKTTT